MSTEHAACMKRPRRITNRALPLQWAQCCVQLLEDDTFAVDNAMSRRVNIKPIQIITGEPAGRNHPRWPRDCPSWQTLKLPGMDRNSASQLDRSPSRRANWAVRRPQDHAALFTTAPHRTSSRPEIRPQTCPRQPEHCHRG